MSTKKYVDFIESAPISRRGKHPPYTEVKFVDITCPHCLSICIELPEEHVKSSKASYCLKHLRVCEAFKAKGGEVASAPEKKHKATKQDTLEKRVERQNEEIERLQKNNASLKADNVALRECAIAVCEEDMYNCFFDFGAGVDSTVVGERMDAAVKQWGRARREKTLQSLGIEERESEGILV